MAISYLHLHTIILNTSLPSASTYWQTTSLETWPLRLGTEKLVAETAKEAPKIVTPYGAYINTQPQPEKIIASHEPEVKQVPQFLHPYGALQPTTHGNLLLLNSPYYAAYSLPLGYVAPSVAPSVATTPSTITSKAKPATTDEVKDVEAVESTEQEVDTIERLQKLQAKTQTTAGDLKSDLRLRAAVSRINSNYVIEEIIAVPG